MANLNVATRYITGMKSNDDVVDLTKQCQGKDNAYFLSLVAAALKSEQPDETGVGIDPGGVLCIGLMGEYGLIGYGIRRAQELIRVDRAPSYWSHCFLIKSPLSEDAAVNRSRARSAWLLESTLEPPDILNSWVSRDGVGFRRIADYTRAKFSFFSQHCVPNIAVIGIGLTDKEREAIIARADEPAVDRLHYDIPGLLGAWFAYLTDQAAHPNPLSQGRAVYCSAFVQLAYDAAGIDLAPGAHQRNTAPEHIWQAVKYLHDAFQRLGDDGKAQRRPIKAWYCARDPACLIAPVDTAVPRTFTELTNQQP